MKCMTWRGNNNFSLDEIDIPKIRPGMCLVKIHTAGICGTDIHITQGQMVAIVLFNIGLIGFTYLILRNQYDTKKTIQKS